ncbi:MAG: glycosyltransferase [Proteobacteria bacterium]|nr:glycosyltransferase [Pseudomonadota bacterium]
MACIKGGSSIFSSHEALKLVYQKLENKEVKLISLDIFDTLIYRNCQKPIDVFLKQATILEEKKLLPNTFATREWQSLRIQAEVLARQEAEQYSNEVGLDDIYKKISSSVIHPNHMREAIISEIEAEKALISLDPYIAALISYLTENKIAYICVSDSYFSEAILAELLDIAFKKSALKLAKPLAIYSSSEYKANKGGTLFTDVLAQHPYQPEHILHIGDNLDADIKGAQRAKINVCFYSNNLNWQSKIDELEKSIQEKGQEQEWIITKLREKAAQFFSTNNQLDQYESYGAYIYGPIFYGFAFWCLQQARNLGLKQIFCFTREAHLLVPLLTMIAEDSDLEIKELAISRQFAKIITIDKINTASLLGLFHQSAMYSAEQVLQTLGLQDCPSFIKATDWISAQQLPDILCQLLATPLYEKQINEFISAKKENYYGYLQSIGFFQNQAVAICDLGWNGTTQHLLRHYLDQYQLELNIHAFYLATTANAKFLVSNEDSVYSYLCHFSVAAYSCEGLFRSPELVELVTMPYEGSMQDILQQKPFFTKSNLDTVQLKQIALVQQGIFHFFALMKHQHFEREKINFASEIIKTYLLSVLLRTILAPIEEEVFLVEKWAHEIGLGTQMTFPLIPNKAWFSKKVANKPLKRLIEGFDLTNCWHAGVLYRTGGNALVELFLLNQVKKLSKDALANILLPYTIDNEVEDLIKPIKPLMHQPKTYDLAPYLLHSLKWFKDLILPLFEKADIKAIVLIGVETNAFLNELCQYLAKFQGKLIAVDPSLTDDFINNIDSQYHNNIELIPYTSEHFFKHYHWELSGNYAFLIDGDHNFQTVYFELNNIHQLFAHCRNNQPLVFVHDVNWPSSYRDFYYQQGSAHNNPLQAQAAVGEGVNFFSQRPFKGANFYLHNATAALDYGGGRNGVKAAIDSFLKEAKDYDYWQIPLLFGLGIVLPKKFANYEDLKNFIAPWTSELFTAIEKNRLEMYLAIIERDQQINDYRLLMDDLKKMQKKIYNLQNKETNLNELNPSPKNAKSLRTLFHRFTKKWKDKKAIAIGKKSSFFDREWYLNTYEDVKDAGVDPLIHYVKYGIYEGREPAPYFSTKDYLSNNPDIKKHLNPLVHLEKKTSYQKWVELYDRQSETDKEKMSSVITLFSKKPLISIIMPVYNAPEKWLRVAIDSVLKQIYPYWELCIADDASTMPHIKKALESYMKQDSRIKVIFREQNGHISLASNSALELATGEYLALFDHDDELPPHALFKVVEEINQHPNAKLIYSDEDKIDCNGNRSQPYFKSDWNPDLLHGHNFISHFGIYQRQLVNEIGGFRKGYEGSQDYDLALRVSERLKADEIRHIPHILYHWRMIPGSTALNSKAKNYAYEAARLAIQSHLDRMNIKAKVTENPLIPHFNRVIYNLPETLPLVSIIIPTKDKHLLLKKCIDSILKKTNYASYEIIVIDNQSSKSKTKVYLNELKRHKQISVLSYDKPFNYASINNFAVSQCKGEVITFLNNDTEIISTNWLDELVSQTLRQEVGIVGAKLYYANKKIQHAGVILGLGKNGIAGHIHHQLAAKNYGYVGKAVLVQNFLAVTGACMTMRREVFNQLKGFEESLAVNYNDVDLCLRAVKLGYRIVFTPFSELYHHESQTRKALKSSDNKMRNREEENYMRDKWGELLMKDPFYNSNLSLDAFDYAIAYPPRKTIRMA